LDAFDTVTAYLIDEGFATTFDEAQKIMTTLDSELIKEVHEHQLNEAMLLTKADKVGNTPAWQNRDKKNVKTGEPIYKKADHLKKEDK
jgi:GTP-binding protein EngB required for normal cell division